ncbi:hypothetical protein [Maridesulfovibrio sp.]|uniref:hypothetical protein n=1 Tax=Maridesulfovibrio sp. TaxID=2795000 RepID=UPI0029F57A14|nr:hypothetical protein [Maridesulfovibrio sp.]
MSFEMFPYMEWDGVRTYPDRYMAGLYQQCVDEGHAEIVFYEGTVRNAAEFVAALKKSVCWVVLKDDVAVALVWLNRQEGRFARMHWVVFNTCPRKHIFEMGLFVNNCILHMKDKDGNYVYDMLLGLIPVRNKVAIKFVEKCGGKICGEVPNGAWIAREGKSENVALISLTRELLYESLH